ncbi:hypothetical protein SLEP1_g39170 [Rubroshorea leprosula]|uniref:Uncharacterized protein n=1 Tax=Rubroshorea leprosula TaxID=152421 RepID=A0AAV5KZD0_9ROSI|nr:hypothetical protein SLEP1_g39170 [Rubroshorea leprosula]
MSVLRGCPQRAELPANAEALKIVTWQVQDTCHITNQVTDIVSVVQYLVQSFSQMVPR